VIPDEPVDVIPMSWQPEAADYAEAFQARNRMRRVQWLVWMMGVLGVALAALAIVGRQPAMAVVAVVIAVFFALMGRLGTHFLLRRNPVLRQPVHAVVDARAGVVGDIPVVSMADGRMRVTAGNWQFPWERLHTVLETKRAFVLHVAGAEKTFFLLAKRGLADPALEPALRNRLRTIPTVR